MKITRVYTDDRGSFIEFLAAPKIEEIEKKYEINNIEYDTPEEAEIARAELKKVNPDVVSKDGVVEEIVPTVKVLERGIIVMTITAPVAPLK